MHRIIGRSRRSPLILGLGLVVAIAFAGIAWAAIPGSNGVISSCYNAGSNPSGQLRIIDAENGAKCGKNEKLLTFSQSGPKGDKGIQGDQGIQGVKGDQGIQGIQGIQGDQGIQGVTGDEGPAGSGGTSDLHQAYNGDGGGPISVTEDAGSYLIVGYAKLYNGISGTGNFRCTIYGSVVASGTLGVLGEQQVPVMGTVQLGATGTITMDCVGTETNNHVATEYKRMFVTKVASIING